MFEFLILGGNVVMVACVSSGEHCTHIRTQKHRGCRKSQGVDALVLLYCCCTAPVVVLCTVAARLLLKSGGVGLYRPTPCAASNNFHVSSDYVFVLISEVDRKYGTHAHTGAPSVAVTTGRG